MDAGQQALLVERLEGPERRVESEKAVQVDHAVVRLGLRIFGAWHPDDRPLAMVGIFAVRHDDIQPIRPAAQEDVHENVLLVLFPVRIDRDVCQRGGFARRPGNGRKGGAHEEAAAAERRRWALGVGRSDLGR